MSQNTKTPTQDVRNPCSLPWQWCSASFSQDIGGLNPETTYYFRAVTTESVGEILQFTTPSLPVTLTVTPLTQYIVSENPASPGWVWGDYELSASCTIPNATVTFNTFASSFWVWYWTFGTGESANSGSTPYPLDCPVSPSPPVKVIVKVGFKSSHQTGNFDVRHNAYIASGGRGSASVLTTLVVQPPPVFNLTCTNSCNFAGVAGGVNPADQTLTINNTGDTSFDWTAAEGQNWLTLSPTSGSTAAGATSNITVSVNISELADGNYTGSIGISPGISGAPVKLMPVKLAIGEPLTITQSVWNIFKKPNLETPITGFPKTFAGKADLIVSGSSVGEGSFQANLLIINSADQAAATVQDFFVIPAQPPPAPLPGPPPNPINSVCEQLTVSWIDVAGETGYRVYRNTTGGTNLANYARVGGDRPADSTSYTETTPPLSAGAAYYYIVTAFNTFGESVVGAGWPVGPTIVNPCIPDLSASRKILYQVNGVAYSGQTIRNGDQLTFRIIIENAGTATAYDLYIVDTVTDNLDYVAGTARLNGNTIAEKVQGNDITWPWPDPSSNPNSNLGDKPVGGTNWTLSFDAIVNSDSSLTVDYIENKGRIYYDLSEGNNNDNLSVPFGTGLIPVRTGQALVPNIREIAP